MEVCEGFCVAVFRTQLNSKSMHLRCTGGIEPARRMPDTLLNAMRMNRKSITEVMTLLSTPGYPLFSYCGATRGNGTRICGTTRW